MHSNPLFTNTQGRLRALEFAGMPVRETEGEDEANAEIAYWQNQAERILELNDALDARDNEGANSEQNADFESTEASSQSINTEVKTKPLSAYMRFKNRIHDKIFNDPLPLRRDYNADLDDPDAYSKLTPDELAYWNEPVQKRSDVLTIDKETLEKMKPEEAAYWREWLDTAPNSVVIPPKLRIDFTKVKKETKLTKISDKASSACGYISDNWNKWTNSSKETPALQTEQDSEVIAEEFMQPDGGKVDRAARKRLHKLGQLMLDGLIASGGSNRVQMERLALDEEERVATTV